MKPQSQKLLDDFFASANFAGKAVSDSKLRKRPIVSWDGSGSQAPSISIEEIDHFSARGMLRVYGRGDHFGRGRIFNLDIWLDRSGHLFARFWARRREVDWQSFEIFGLPHPLLPTRKSELDEMWAPQSLREKYDNWIILEG